MPTQRQKQIYKLIMLILLLIAFGIGIYMAVVLFGAEGNEFTKHFALPICLACIAGIAFLMPLATRTKFGGDPSKDNMMMLVALFLFLFAILVCILSYFGFGIGL